MLIAKTDSSFVAALQMSRIKQQSADGCHLVFQNEHEKRYSPRYIHPIKLPTKFGKNPCRTYYVDDKLAANT